MVWRTLHSRSEFSLKDYMQTLKTNDDQAGINFVSHHIQTCIDFKENYQKRGNVKSLLKKALFFNDKNSFYLCFSYLFTKLIYLAVIIFQILVLNYWLKDEHYKGNFIFGKLLSIYFLFFSSSFN